MTTPPFPEERALEHTAFALGLVPTSIYRVLLPVWQVTVESDVLIGEAYELIDRYLERGIAEGQLDSVADLARFFALEPALVDQAVRFLSAIGHLEARGERLALTALGRRSVRDGVRYVSTLRDRRVLLFEALRSTPLTAGYYDPEIGLLTGEEVLEADRRTGIYPLNPRNDLHPDALPALAGLADRRRYNLPEQIVDPVSHGADLAFLPAYLVRTAERGLFVYTKPARESDPELSRICAMTDWVANTLDAEEREQGSGDDIRTHMGRWLSQRGLADHLPTTPTTHGWQVTLPGASFGGATGVSLAKVGSFVVRGSSFFRIWCRDEGVRRRALLERVDAMYTRRVAADRETVQARIGPIASQLSLGPVGVDELHRAAVADGRTGLAVFLRALE